ncbi:hypothetical protein D3C78_1853180 [compost metagenome]
MGIAVIINFSSFDKIRFPIDPYCKVTALFSFHFKLTLSARSLHHLNLLRGLRKHADSQEKKEYQYRVFHLE